MEGLDIDSYLHDIERGGLDKLRELAHYTMGSPYVVNQVIGGINSNILQLKKILEDLGGSKELRPNEAQRKLIGKLITKVKNNFLVIKGYTEKSNLTKKSEQECNRCVSRFEIAILGLAKSLNQKGMSIDLEMSIPKTLPKQGEPYYIENWSSEKSAEFKTEKAQQSYINSPSNINDYIVNIVNLVGSLEKTAVFAPNTVGNKLLEDVKINARAIKEKSEVSDKGSYNRIQVQMISQLMDRMQSKILLVQKKLSYQSPGVRDGSARTSISQLETNVMGMAKTLNQKGMSLDLDKFTPRFIPAANKDSSEELGKWSSKSKEKRPETRSRD